MITIEEIQKILSQKMDELRPFIEQDETKAKRYSYLYWLYSQTMPHNKDKHKNIIEKWGNILLFCSAWVIFQELI